MLSRAGDTRRPRAQVAALLSFVAGVSVAFWLRPWGLVGGGLSNAGPGAVDVAWAQQPSMCHLATSSGLCVADVFAAVDEAYRDAWPGSVDLVLRTFVSNKFFLLEALFKSIHLMWPRGIGDVILVLDKGNTLASSLVPDWVKVVREENYLKLPGKMLQQWSYAWADLYSDADFIAIIDDDCIFTMKVTPPLLFNLTEGTPFVIGSSRHQDGMWVPATEFFVGPGKYRANFMVQLPFIMPRRSLPAFRAHVAQRHSPEHASFDRAFRYYSEVANETVKFQIQHTTMGNFLLHYMPNQVHVALEWTRHMPIPRVAAHVPWTNLFERKQPRNARVRAKVNDIYAHVASHYALEGLCHSLPGGELAGCTRIRGRQDQVWMYALDWVDWPALREPDGTSLYDKYVRDMHCMYRVLVDIAKQNKMWAHDLQRAGSALKSCLSSSGTPL